MTSSLFPFIQSQRDGIPFKQAGIIVCVDGTVYPGSPGIPMKDPGQFSSWLAYRLMELADGLWNHFFICYAANMFPMLDSMQDAANKVVSFVLSTPPGTKIVLTGYSQGAGAICLAWRKLASTNRIDDIVLVYNFGDPYRTPGIAYGNELAGTPTLSSSLGGIAGMNVLKPAETPRHFKCFAKPGDIYTSWKIGETPWLAEIPQGEDGRVIFDAVMKFDGQDIFAFVRKLTKIVSKPFDELFPLVQAIWNGLVFLGKGPEADHWKYFDEAECAVQELISVGKELVAA